MSKPIRLPKINYEAMTCLIILSPILLMLIIYLTHERILIKKDTREQKRIEKKKVEYFNKVDYNSDKK
jgi:hypothetical protein